MTNKHAVSSQIDFLQTVSSQIASFQRDDCEHDTDQSGEKVQGDPCEYDIRAGVVGDRTLVHSSLPLLVTDVQEQVVGDKTEHEYDEDTDRCGDKVHGDPGECEKIETKTGHGDHLKSKVNNLRYVLSNDETEQYELENE